MGAGQACRGAQEADQNGRCLQESRAGLEMAPHLPEDKDWIGHGHVTHTGPMRATQVLLQSCGDSPPVGAKNVGRGVGNHVEMELH